MMLRRKSLGRSTKSRRATSADHQTSVTSRKESTMNLPPQAAPVMRGHDRGNTALPPQATGLVIGQSGLPCSVICGLLPAPYNAICQAVCPVIP
jgi:hypothetical protein